MKNYRRAILIVYILVGLFFIAWSYSSAMQGKSETALIPYWLLFFWSFPMSVPVAYLLSLIESTGILGNSVLSGYVTPLAMLIAGYFQWFQLVPYLARKISSNNKA